MPNSHKHYRCRPENNFVIIYNFFANFYVVVFIITISKFCGFASVIGEK